ncbi:MAG: carboxypeptidase regulatory-like domain-containing protein, partial [Planctomycetales bacterium]|nr:carboxypeptidase regulatory-like domain-containing protein [Planctomycetales bacterium]
MRPSCSPRLTFVQFSRFCLLAFGGLPFLLSGAPGAELLVLDPTNFDEAVPHGKEVDSIYGDFLLRNEHVVAVIAQPRAERDANMTVREVGGCLIDLSTRAPDTNDQLSAFYPGASQFAYRSAEIYTGDGRWETKSSAAENLVQHSQIGLRCIAPSSPGKPRVTTTYWLADHARVLEVITVISNPHDEEVSVNVRDSIRSDKGFEAGFDADRNMVWVHDEWWRKAYGFIPQGTKSLPNAGSLSRARPVIDYVTAGDEQVQPQAVKLGSGQSLRLSRWIVPAANLLELRGLADQVRGLDLRTIHVSVQDDQGPIDHARVELFRGDTSLGVGRTLLSGSATFQVPPGDYRVIVSAIGRTDASCSFTADQSEVVVSMEQPGYVAAKITAEDGSPIACKVEFRGTAGGADPDFGPDTEVWQVKNLVYTENGSFTQAIAPGTYDIIISHGPEYDAIFANIKVERGGTTQLEGKLIRSVNTTGWVSSDFHSHSTPSGDNTSSQLGRVLNLLAEHVEFAPCTEHNRISTYGPHLQRLQAEHRMATCTGMELTGGPLPVNHQNAFPLQMRPRTQDGGAPRTDLDPVVQIERL